MLICEIFYSLQGEGTYIGTPSIFIRTSACNLRCNFCFVPNTLVDTLKDGRVKIKDLKIGDKVLTLNPSTMQLEETIITNILNRKVNRNDVVSLKFSNTTRSIITTKDHPFYVKDKGFTRVEDLSVGDIIIGSDQRELMANKMRKLNPMKDPIISAKVGKKISDKFSQGLLTKNISQKLRDVSRARMLSDKNPMKNSEIVKKQMANSFKTISNLESKYIRFFNQNKIPFVFSGAMGKKSVGDKESHLRFPDFIDNINRNKIIEIYDSTFKYGYKENRYFRDQNWINKTQQHYKKFGFDSICLNEKDLKNKQELKNKIFEFLYNGFVVKEKKSLNNKQIARLEGHSTDEISVVNLQTESHTFLCYGCLVHNCDTYYTSWWNEGQKLSIENIYNSCISHTGYVKHIVITGGEPMLQKDLPELVNYLKKRKHFVTIETNGTIYNPDVKPHLFSISPKTKNSIPNKNNYPKDVGIDWKIHYKTFHVSNMKFEALANFVKCKCELQFKFVVQDNDDLREIEEIVKQYKISDETVFLMPEGYTRELQEKRSTSVAEICKNKKWNFCPRLQINLWGIKRGV